MIVIIRIDQEKYLFSLLDLGPPSKIQYSSYGREGAQPRGEENNHHHVYWVNDPNDSITWFGHWQSCTFEKLFDQITLETFKEFSFHNNKPIVRKVL